ncbi:MAG TPA: SPOR domain-containing protein [Pseudomonadales bacterium]|nr:SPOR domain-containing protein [Pseudomonadales bacterium]
MRRFLVLVSLVLVAVTALASSPGDKFWVVASFSSFESAKVERLRVQKSTGDQVRIAKFDLPEGTMYRLLVADNGSGNMEKSKLQSAGYSPWSVDTGSKQLDFVEAGTDQQIAYRLILGSFQNESHADAFASKMTGAGFAKVETARVTGDTNRYRVVDGPFDARDPALKSKAAAAGVADAWWLATTIDVPHQETAMQQETPAPQPQEALTPPAPGEDLFDYCLRKADARERKQYCDNERFAAAFRAALVRQGGADSEAIVEFCSQQATPEERAKYCNDVAFSSRAVR